jgi:hypothetical protein
MARCVRDVKPVYGNGWWCPTSENSREVPAPFRLECKAPDGLIGTVLDEHEFSGALVHLSPRHRPHSGHFDVAVTIDGQPIAYGYAQA